MKIALNGAGGAGSFYIIENLKSLGYEVIAMDMNPYSAGLYIADKYYLTPTVTSDDYINVLSDILAKEKVDVYLPLIDEELLLMDKIETKVLIPNRNFVINCLDKYLLYQTLTKNNISCPKTIKLNEVKTDEIIDFPIILKPRTGRGSRGVFVIKNINEFEEISSSIINKESYILQKCLEGNEYTVSVVVSKSGKLLSIVPKRIISKQGITKAGITEKNDLINELCKKIVDKLNPRGPFNVQLIIDNNIPKIFEINPRFSTTVALTIESGVNEVDMLIRDALGEDVNENFNFEEGKIILRYTGQIFPKNIICD